MSVHLVGGGWNSGNDASEVYGTFVAEAAARASADARMVPRITVIVVRDGDGEAHAAKLISMLRSAGEFDAVVTRLRHDERVVPAAVANVDAIVVGGGLTPAYLAALRPVAQQIRARVNDGVPYLGFSAGSMIAAERAIIGGWRIDDVEVSPEDGSEDLDEVHIEAGLGLVNFAVDVHAAQWGNLSRLLAATDAGLVDGGVAIDECTALIVAGPERRVVGAGHVWQAVPGPEGMRVSLLP